MGTYSLTEDRKESAFYLGSSHAFTTSKKSNSPVELSTLRYPYILKKQMGQRAPLDSSDDHQVRSVPVGIAATT